MAQVSEQVSLTSEIVVLIPALQTRDTYVKSISQRSKKCIGYLRVNFVRMYWHSQGWRNIFYFFFWGGAKLKKSLP